jgi:hypothetical protein
MKKTIKDHILDQSKQYPGQLFSADDLASKIARIADVEVKSVKKVLSKLTQTVGENPWILRQPGQNYQFAAIASAPKKKRKPTPKMKGRTFVAVIRDHSGSMGKIARPAMKDFNETLENLKKNSKLSATTLTVIECGIKPNRYSPSDVNVALSNAPIDRVTPLATYPCPGGTPLLDSIGKAIEELKNIPNVQPIDAFMVIVITDGDEQHSKIETALSITAKISKLQQTGQWTFAFRIPHGNRYFVSSLGVPAENIVEWEQTERGVAFASAVTMSAMDNYYQDRSVGLTKSVRFFADTSNLNTQVLNQNLVDISRELNLLQVRVSDPPVIKEFFKTRVGEYTPGCGFYQLVKNEKVQSYKQIIIRDKKTGAAYSGASARQMLGFPASAGDIKVAPGSFSQYDIYIQSTSVNRILPLLSQVLYWKNAK